MKSRQFFSLRLIAVAMTLFALVGERLLPEKKFVLYPGGAKEVELFSDEANGGNSRAYWTNEKAGEWVCELREGADTVICGVSMVFSTAPYDTMDLSGYTNVDIDIDYTGPASRIRVYARNHHILYSSRQNIEAAKFMSVILRTSDLHPTAQIKVSEFYVADWWKEQFNIPRELSQTDFRQIVSFGIDHAPPLAYGDHKYRLKRIVFKGDWLSSEHLYLGIIIIWMLLLGAEALSKIIYLGRHTTVDQERLNQLKLESQHLQKLSTTDVLTQLPNRAGTQQHINVILQEQPDLTGYSLLVIDVDHFKRINDQRGHDVGDRVLRILAKRLKDNLIDSGFFARWGGEEFILIVQSSEIEHIEKLAEKLRAMVHVNSFEPDRPLKISVSIGCAIAQQGEAFAELFRRADEELYTAKKMGRNCVCIDKLEHEN